MFNFLLFQAIFYFFDNVYACSSSLKFVDTRIKNCTHEYDHLMITMKLGENRVTLQILCYFDFLLK